MNWLARLKKTESTPISEPTKPTKAPFVGFVGTYQGAFQKSEGESSALAGAFADPANDPAAPVMAQDALAVPDTPGALPACGAAMTAQELDVLLARLGLFTDRGLSIDEAEAMAERLTYRDRGLDDRRLCLECQHVFSGAGIWRCSQWRMRQHHTPDIPGDLVTVTLHRCTGFQNRLEATP